MGNKCRSLRLSPLAWGVSFGIVCGLSKMLMILAAAQWGYGTSVVALLADLYPGVAATVKGSFCGLGWGYLEGFVMGVIFSSIYNLCLCCCSRYACCCCNKTTTVNNNPHYTPN